MAISTSQGLVQRFAMGLYGVQLGNATMTAVLEEVKTIGGITKVDGLFNWYYAVSFGAKPVADVAATLAANLGIVAGQNGLTAGFVTFAKDYITSVLNAAAPEARGAAVSKIIAAWENLSANAEVGAAVKAWEASTTYAVNYSNVANTTDMAVGTVVSTFNLSAGNDTRTGTAGNDTFVANFSVEGNTLNSGDVINGGAGNDQIKAIMATQSFSITPTVNGVETIAITAQSGQWLDNGQNNVSSKDAVQLDFGRVSGIKTIENFDSRADLSVEDVRIQDNEITKDITIVMRDTDPGAVDFAVYFDQNSLRSVSNTTSTIRLQVMDTNSVNAGTAPLLNSPYGGFRFTATDANGVAQVVTLQSQAIDDAQTYAALQAAFQAEANAKFGAGVVTVALGAAYTVSDTTTGKQVTGTEVNISASGAFTFTTPTGSGWLANGVVPANSGLHTNFFTGGGTSTDLVTSTIVLDNVGRGSNAGDLIVGGLSTGITSTSKGVQQFDITVEDNSKLSNILSTNNTLQVVNIKNGTTDEMSDAYTATVKNAGNLTVGVNNDQDSGLESGPQSYEDRAAGFTDVRVINAATMTGKLSFTAELTEAAVAKYLNLKDTLAPAADNIAVTYTGGTNDDTMVVTFDDAAVASNSNVNTGREDFTFAVNGGNGNDTIDVAVDRSIVLVGNAEDWYSNQVVNDNITISGGAGNDTIKTPGAGNMNIAGDAGNDTIYADNTGVQTAIAALNSTGVATAASSKATFVFNTAVQGADDAAAQDLYDLLGAARTTTGSFGVSATVTFKGLTAKAALADSDYRLSDLEVNQAIKQAINSDAVLSKLLEAKDGPSGTLIVTSLIDGALATTDLGVTFSTVAAGDLNATVLAAYNTANTTTIADTTALAAAINTNIAAIAGRWTTQTADSTIGAEIVGAASTTTSDNKITGGEGDDVVVLGTTLGATVVASSNDTLVFSGLFGNDVVVNFATTGFGADVLNFKGYLGTTATSLNAVTDATATAVASTDSLIQRAVFDNTGTALTGVRNDSAAEVAKLYTDDTTANKGLYVVVDSTNKGTVYQIVDGAAASDMTVTLVGSVDLADTAWNTLVLANFA